MSPEEFLREFGHLAETEGGLTQLRALVLDLAIQGRLGDQRDEEEPPIVPEIEGLPGIRLPASWRWALPDTLAANAKHALTIGPFGSSLLKSDYTDSGVPLVFVRDVTSNSFGDANPRFVSREKAKELKAHTVRAGDLLITKMGTPPGDTAIYPSDRPDGIVTADVVKFTANNELILTEFLRLAINSPQAKQAILGITMGVAHQKISLKRFREVPLPLPPLPEQKRIVEKVDQLMALCDELEAKQKEKRAKAVSFNQSALSAVVHAPDKSKLKSAWSRVQDHFEVLYELPENVKELRQAILQLAVMGKLVRQDPREEPFPLPGRARPPSTPTRLPPSWALPVLGDLGEFMGGGTPSKSNADYWAGNIPWVSPKDMKILWLSDSQDHVAESAIQETVIKLIPRGSVLCVVRGMILAHSFPVALNEVPVTINQDMKALVPVVPQIAPYLLLALRGLRNTVLCKVERSSHGTCRLASEELSGLRVPLPPLAEQGRIVAKADQLMSFCDDLEACLAQHRGQGQRLMQAVVEGLVA